MNGQWLQDEEFDTLIRNVENNYITYESEACVKALLQGRACKRGTLNDIKDKCFNGNVDLTVFILTRLKLYFRKSDVKKFEMLRIQYEQKVDKYLERLQNIEENIVRNRVTSYESMENKTPEER